MAGKQPDDGFLLYGRDSEDTTREPTRQEAGEGRLSDGNTIAGEQLRSIVERIENLEEGKAAIGDDIKAVYAEARAGGFDTKILRQVVRLRKQDPAERQQQDATRELYLHALGMLPDFEGDE